MKHLLTAALLSLSVSSLAAELKCDFIALAADGAGFANFLPSFSLKAEIQKETPLNAKKCNQILKDNNLLTFCAAQAPFVGGYDTFLYVVDNGNLDGIQNFASMATSRKNNKELIRLYSDSELLYGPYTKVVNAKIPFIRYWNGEDAAELDEVVKNAVNQNVLKHNDILFYKISSCKVI